MSNNEESVESQEQGQKEVPEQLQSTPPPSPKGSPKATGPPPPVNKTGINARLDDALMKMKRVNRSSDLIPLNHQYDLMRKELKALIAAAKTYKANVLSMDKARTEVSCK